MKGLCLFVRFVAMAFVVALALGACDVFYSGDYVLIVETADGEGSTRREVEQSLERGGQIELSTDLARRLDREFDQKYAVGDEEGQFLVTPALLNFVGDRGWKFQAVSSGLGERYYFRKPR